eukprot:CAMPEP_0194087012 /NCGR_PEP_ID=MMETSP0149-20130528/23487_1 /TAXON_ID=122233 /ORGANISM="Chaetoceros debilis, Strain MM31A-1" /LENGTH=593 /DNA_ID=CAMNT_0038770255 /DNA_START=191 /DNA_END=1972 /DNA_ORIENTATION=-
MATRRRNSIYTIPSVSITCIGKLQQIRIEHMHSIASFHRHSSSDSATTKILSSSPITKNASLIQRIISKLRALAETLLNTLLVAWRTGEIAIRLSPLIILTPAAILNATCDEYGPNSSNAISDLAWTYSLYTVQHLGPTFVKLCQWAATRRDLFPSHVCDRLSKLQDAAFLHSWKHTHKILSDAFGDNYESFAADTKSKDEKSKFIVHVKFGNYDLKIDPKDVIGSGSIAQVYKGILRQEDRDGGDSNGDSEERAVAVKVLHPQIHERVERDLDLMTRVASIVDSLPIETIKMMNLPKIANNFAMIMRNQLDLRRESDHLLQFSHNFAPIDSSKGITSIAKVSFPEPIMASADCLIEDYEDALPISHYIEDETHAGLALRRELAGPLLRAFLKMVFMDNFVHSDLHQGNIKVRKTRVFEESSYSSKFPFTLLNSTQVENENRNRYEDKYTIVFLDAGIVTELNQRDQQNLKDLFKAIILNDGKKAGRLMVERARYERCTEVEGGLESFSMGIENIVSEFHNRRKQGLTLGVVRIGSLLGNVLELCRSHGVEIDPAMSNIVMSTLVLEGLGRSLDSNLNLIDIAIPFILGRGKV